MPSLSLHSPLQFGVFEVDARSGELRKQGFRIKLHEKPFQVLLALLENPGEVVSRKELQARLWPQDTYVEFENGLNNAISRLRDVLGDSATSPHFIETVPRQGYRFLASVSHSLPASRHAPIRRWLLVAGSLIAAAFAVGAVSRLISSASKPSIKSLAVLPFQNLDAGAENDYLCAGVTDAVTTELAELGVSKVISETSVRQFKDTKKTVPQIAEILGVDAIVEGAVQRQGNNVRITVQLIRGDTDRHIWAATYESDLNDIFRLQNVVALGVARGIELRLSPHAAVPSNSSPPLNPEAYVTYLKGEFFLKKSTEESFARAKSFFEQSVQLDENYAPAYAGLANYYLMTDSIPPVNSLAKAKEYAQKALHLDERLPIAHACLGFVYFYGDWNWTAAEKELTRAVALDPNFALAHRWHAMYLAAMGRDTEAMMEIQRSEELDPLSISAYDAAATAAVWARQYDRSIQEGRKIFELDPQDPRAYEHMAVGLFQEGKFHLAIEDAEKGLELTHRDPLFLFLAAYAYGRQGQTKQAARLVAELRAAARKRYVPPFFLATALIGTGDQKAAVDALEEGYKVRGSYMVFLRCTPWFDALRPDPRFENLLHRMNFPPLPHGQMAARSDTQVPPAHTSPAQ